MDTYNSSKIAADALLVLIPLYFISRKELYKNQEDSLGCTCPCYTRLDWRSWAQSYREVIRTGIAMDDDQTTGIMAWAIIATIVAAVCAFGWSNSSEKWNAVMGDSSSITTINDVVDEDNANYQAGSKLVETYNQLAQNAQDECDTIDSYFGSAASDACLDQMFGNGPPGSTSLGDYDFSTDYADSMQAQLDDINNPQQQ